MRLIKFIIVLILTLSISNCARRGNPTGGPKDENAPITIKTIPEFETVNFDKNEIVIYFDEYIKLKDLNKNLIVSPPFKYPAEITPLGTPSKKITIKIKDTLLSNTTYSLNFGESIEDNNEGNVLKGFKYVFSTGNHIDSLSIKGNVSSALSKETDKYVAICLYDANKTFNDSTIYKEKPLYVTNTLDSLGWKISNLKKGKYHLVAIKEESNDFLFNPKTDKIAFLDTVISVPSKKEYNLKLFKEILEFKAFKPIEVSKGHLIFGYEGDGDGFKIKPDIHKSGIENISSKIFKEKEKDTLNYYFTTKKPIDSLFFKLIKNNYLLEEKAILRSKEIDSLIVKSNIRGTLNFRDTLTISTNNPYDLFDKNQFSIYDKDTIAVDFELKRKNHQDLLVLFNKKENQNYRITIFPKAITDFFKQVNKDTITYNLRTKKKDNYGSINLSFTNDKDKTVIVQLLDIKEKLIAQKHKNSIGKVNFDLLLPGKYLIRIIYDENQNGIWDTGNYLKKLQPEKTMYFSNEIEVKENWFINETINLK